MPRSAEQLALRRQALVLRSAALRDALNADLRGIAPAFTTADRAQDAWLWLRARPLAMVLPAVAVAVVWVVRKPSRLITSPLRVWSLWRLWQRVATRLV
jgi:hypothetical protein